MVSKSLGDTIGEEGGNQTHNVHVCVANRPSVRALVTIGRYSQRLLISSTNPGPTALDEPNPSTHPVSLSPTPRRRTTHRS